MRKKIFTLLLAMLGFMPAVWADDGVWIERLNGTKQVFLFSQEPEISFNDYDFVITTTAATATFPYDEIKRIYFDSDIVSGINGINADDSRLMRVTPIGAELSGFPAGTAVNVYDLRGFTLAQWLVPSGGQLSVNLSAFPQGIYIIQAEKVTLKIQKK